MRKKKKFSLFEKLTGSIHMDDFDDEYFDDEEPQDGEEPLYDSLEDEEDEDFFKELPQKKSESSTRTPLAQKMQKTPRTPAPLPKTSPKTETLEETPTHRIKNSLPTHNPEIPVDIIETSDTIYIRTEITGIDPDSVDIDLTRDTLVLSATKKERRLFGDDEYLHRELFWGEITRSLDLPDEVEVEEAEAHAEFGVLLITLPKIDKAKKTKLQIGKKTKAASTPVRK